MNITPIDKYKKNPPPSSAPSYTCISVQKDCIVVAVSHLSIGFGRENHFTLDGSKKALKLFNGYLKEGCIAVPAIGGNSKRKGSPDIPK